jgi:hypothetical protein
LVHVDLAGERLILRAGHGSNLTEGDTVSLACERDAVTFFGEDRRTLLASTLVAAETA